MIFVTAKTGGASPANAKSRGQQARSNAEVGTLLRKDLDNVNNEDVYNYLDCFLCNDQH